jgi:hypothetical protein
LCTSSSTSASGELIFNIFSALAQFERRLIQERTNAEGEPVKAVAPLHDATLGDHEALFTLLECYLRALPLPTGARGMFCGSRT